MGDVARRRFLAGAGALVAAALAHGQGSGRPAVLGILSHNPAPARPRSIPLLERLKALGWSEDGNLVVERAYANRDVELLPRLANGLVAKRVDLIWAGAPAAAVAAARATRTIPIVFANVTFPVELGLVDSLAKPGRNATGVGFLAGGMEQAAKPLEFLRQISPDARRLAHFWTPAVMRDIRGEEVKISFAPFDEAAAALGFELQLHEVFKAADFDRAFAAALGERTQAVLALATPLNWTERKRIVDFANRSTLPSAFDARAYAEIGGLLAYGPDVGENVLESANIVDRILRGAQPAELPVRLPGRHELAVNLKTARALRLTVPPSILARADRVIE